MVEFPTGERKKDSAAHNTKIQFKKHSLKNKQVPKKKNLVVDAYMLSMFYVFAIDLCKELKFVFT